ncbi:MAG: hypothetical protein FD138_1893 [Planctomycetota bacterium]|nr:MAG: hypothetical protein FD138_1893 [Planctomycetota bacterium]
MSRGFVSGKMWLFRVGALLVSLGLLEFVSFLVIHFWPWHTGKEFQLAQKSIARMGEDPHSQFESLHPYLGWVFNPDSDQPAVFANERLPVNSLGFVDAGESVRKRSPDRIIVGVFGGSVAQQVTTSCEAALRKQLDDVPELAGKDLQIVRLAMSGFKQPQQLMALNYILTLGGEFDVVINLDGYNETALAEENDRSGIFAAYPWLWSARLQDVVDPRLFSLSYRLLQVRASRQQAAQWITQSSIRWTNSANLFWLLRDNWLHQQRIDLEHELLATFRTQGHGFAQQGPKQLYGRSEQMDDHLVNEELKRFYAPDESQAQSVARLYPQLIGAGAELRGKQVHFHDLTQLFVDETDTIYADYFCHYNQRGNELLGSTLAQRIVERLRSP